LNKQPVFDWFWAQGDVLVTISTKTIGVDLPQFLREKEVVDFILGVDLTPRLQADDKGILVGMRFSGAPHTCFFPWDSVLRMECPNSVIQFRAGALNSQSALQSKEKPAPVSAKEKRPNLKLVK